MNRMHPGTPPSRRPEKTGDWRDRTRKAALFLVKGLGQAGRHSPDEIRTKVIQAAREALSQAPGRPMYKPVELPTPDGKGTQPDHLVSSAGVLRLPLVEFRLNWSDPMMAESFMAEVVGVLDAELPNTDGRGR